MLKTIKAKNHFLILLAFFFAFSFPAFSESEDEVKKQFFGANDEVLTKIVSFDFESLLLGIKNHGWGFGIRYEKYIAYHVAFTARFGHATFYLEDWGWCPTVSMSLFAEIYPFSEGLHGFYGALGSSFDFLGVDDETVEKEYVSIFPFVGIKMRLNRFLSADLHGGYKKIVDGKSGTFSESSSLVGNGVKIGASLKIHLSEIF